MTLPLLLAHTNVTWHAIPLALLIALVYSASRYEQSERIIRRGLRLFATILLFMVGVFVALYLLSFGL